MEELDAMIDPARPAVRVEHGVARAEYAQRMVSRSAAEQMSAIHETLTEARAFPEIFLGPLASRSSSRSSRSARESVEFALRAAVADLAVRLCLSEASIRLQDAHAATLIARTPRVWSAFRDGEVSTQNAKTTADVAATLPDDDNSTHAEFDAAVFEAARTQAPARYRTRARALRERIAPENAPARHKEKAKERGVWVEPDHDGMAWLTAYIPADAAYRAKARVDGAALSLFSEADEERTFMQLRADVLSDLLAGVGVGHDSSVGVRVAVTVPVMTLLGLGENGDASRPMEGGTLEGYGPIDAETARRLAAHAPSFTRILTHPITGTILDIDRTSYRPPADLERFVDTRDPVCTFAGCGRPARECDIDHMVPWSEGGTTSADNLNNLCRSHHTVKHESGWTMTRGPNGEIIWISPTGHRREADPPPF